MLFQSAEFLLFLIGCLALFYLLPRRFRWAMLGVASYVFYGYWNWRFIPLLLGLTVLDYFVALWLEKASTYRRTALTVSVAANLGVLFVFKYFNFGAATFAGLLGKPSDAYAIDVILPLGISFHTFQSISYIVDVYRRQQPVIRNFIEYGLFISFFPQLIAGPIVRAHEFFRELWHWKNPTADDVRAGIHLFILGFLKKTVFADQFAAVSDAYFGNLAAHPGLLAAWSGVIAFAFQIFFDFSGYTDMARGCARLFGFYFPENFARPYLAGSITDFWRRWHMTLSRWLRDYLYIPLGGSRVSHVVTYRNLILTMMIGGLWHGASWNFAIWGTYHGCLLAIERLLGSADQPSSNPLTQGLRVVRTFVLVSAGWVFFRAADLPQSIVVFREMISTTTGAFLFTPVHVVLLVIAVAAAVREQRSQWLERLPWAPGWVQVSTYTALFFAAAILAAPGGSVPFIYFQF